MVIDDGVDVVEANPGLLVRRAVGGAATVSSPAAAVGIRSSFLTSMCSNSPGRARSSRTAVVFDARITSPVIGSQTARCDSLWRRRIRLTVRAGTPSRGRASPDRGDARAGRRRLAPRSPVTSSSASRAAARSDPRRQRRPRHRSGRSSDGPFDGTRHRSSDMGNWHVLLAHSLHEQAAAEERQTGVTVTDEDLPGFAMTAITTRPGGPHFVNDPSPTSWPGTASPTSVRGRGVCCRRRWRRRGPAGQRHRYIAHLANLSGTHVAELQLGHERFGGYELNA